MTPKRALRIAVKAIDAPDPALGSVLTDAVVAELRKLERLSVIGLDEVQAMLDLEAQKQLAGCSESSCIAEIAAALGADILVVGSVNRVDDGAVFALKRLEQIEGRADGQVVQRLADAGGEESLAMVGPAVEQLFREFPLRTGEERGVDDELALRLNPPPVPVWAFATVASVTAAALVTTAVAGGINVATYAAGSAEAEKSLETTQSGASLRDQDALVTQTFVVVVAAGTVTAVGALATGVCAFFTDWAGYGDVDEEAVAASAR